MQTTITDRGEICIPAQLREEMHLVPGQTIVWEKISSTECRITVPAKEKARPDPFAALNFAAEHGLATVPTAEWMKMMRDGDGRR